MALPGLLRPFSKLLAAPRLPSGCECTSSLRLIRRSVCHTQASARSKFYVREPPHDKPDWLKVGLTLGTTVFLWIYLIKQHNEDVLEYKRRNGLE